MKHKTIEKRNSKHNSLFKLYIIALIAVSSDVITTYIATPDLKYEGNLFVLYFKLNWTGVLIYCFGGLQLYFAIYWLATKVLEKTHNRLIVFILKTVIATFYTHIVLSFLMIPNNLIGWMYLNHIHIPIISNITNPVLRLMHKYPNYYFLLVAIVFVGMMIWVFFRNPKGKTSNT